ncbi:hypothetical protein [Acetobacter thailandicus]|uniref:Uncharacterized protein n=1 Tax=Acetobacter thailandicus TaxID=1502842 RepID=A0ABT3QEH0_9PROT|nr:hypothetical protein [Acetobacter thailandicus]MCX2563686.1 hypothetical protein [Acetobacter thailandicus]
MARTPITANTINKIIGIKKFSSVAFCGGNLKERTEIKIPEIEKK